MCSMCSRERKTTRVAVISDTHGRLPRAVFEVFRHVDYLLHAGDVGSLQVMDDLFLIAPAFAVLGNNDVVDDYIMQAPDYDHFAPKKEWRLTLGGMDFYVTHMPEAADRYLRSCTGTDGAPTLPGVCINGHTHQPRNELVNGVLRLNPGSPTRPRGGTPPSVALVMLSEGRVESARIITLPPGWASELIKPASLHRHTTKPLSHTRLAARRTRGFIHIESFQHAKLYAKLRRCDTLCFLERKCTLKSTLASRAGKSHAGKSHACRSCARTVCWFPQKLGATGFDICVLSWEACGGLLATLNRGTVKFNWQQNLCTRGLISCDVNSEVSLQPRGDVTMETALRHVVGMGVTKIEPTGFWLFCRIGSH